MKVLFFAYYFPPFVTAASVRNNKIAKYLTRFGHDVRVISCDLQALPPLLDVEIPKEKVIHTPWINLCAPMLFAQNLIKSFSGQNPALDNAPDGENLFPVENRSGSGWKTKLARLYQNAFVIPDATAGWFPFAIRAGNRLLREWRPDLILGSCGPKSNLLVASWFSRKHGIPWVADYHDLWIENPMMDLPPWRLRMEKRLERRALSNVAGLVSENENGRETLRTKSVKPVAIVTNGFDPSDYPGDSTGSKNAGVVRIVHLGKMYKKVRDPSPLFQAMNLLGQDKARIKLDFYTSDSEDLMERAREFKVAHLVEIHPLVSHRESLRIQRESDILLLLFISDDHSETALKFYEYLGARRPILCLGSGERDMARIIQSREAGFCSIKPQEIAEQLSAWIQRKKLTGEIPLLPPGVGKGLTNEEQIKGLEIFLVKILAANRTNIE